MKFKLERLIIDDQLKEFAIKKIRQHKLSIPKASRKILKELAEVLEEIQKNGLPKYLILHKLQKGVGYGIFLHPEAKPILKGQVIAPYSGEVALYPQNQGESSDYMFSLITDLVLSKKDQLFWDPDRCYHPKRLYSIDLDADKKGNFTRFINHSEQPNIEASFLRIPANSLGLTPAPFELLYVAKKTIRPGEQLLVCYEGEDKSYWSALNIKPFPMTPKTFKINAVAGKQKKYTVKTKSL